MAFTSINTSASSLVAFSRALDTISDNLSNLNTVGFQRQNTQFRDLSSGGRDDKGDAARDLLGVEVADINTQFSQGELRETGSSTDVAFDGPGFFVINRGGHTVFTRDGQFRFDDDGYLVQQAKEAGRVQGVLGDIRIDSSTIAPPQATSRARFSGNLSVGSEASQVSVQIIDGAGARRDLNLRFQRDADAEENIWRLEISDQENGVLAQAELTFDADGSLAQNSGQVSVPIEAVSAASTTVILEFGSNGDFGGVTSVPAGSESNVRVENVDGRDVGLVQGARISEQGEILLGFTNGEEQQIDQLQLALVRDTSVLKRESGTAFSLIVPFASQDVVSMVTADSPGLGGLVIGSAELANVELSSEFADIIILQRGFQAGSQILNVSNEILQQLYESTAGR